MRVLAQVGQHRIPTQLGALCLRLRHGRSSITGLWLEGADPAVAVSDVGARMLPKDLLAHSVTCGAKVLGN